MYELDSFGATYGQGKTTAIAVAHKGYTLDLLGQPMADINRLSKKQQCIAAYYGYKTPCSSMADCRQQQCVYTIGTSTTTTKLCRLPPTIVSFEQYFRRAHRQVAL